MLRNLGGKLSGVVEKGLKKIGITVSKPILAIICIIFGIVVIAVPELLGILVGIFLIIEGVLLLTDYMEIRKQQTRSSSEKQ
ncbi:MAG: hypothetical protein QXK90_03195 [Candidatus Parvarchaeota archaeon]